MITHRRSINPDLESRKKEIKDILHTNKDNLGKLDNLLGIRHYYDDDWLGSRKKLIEMNYPIEVE